MGRVDKKTKNNEIKTVNKKSKLLKRKKNEIKLWKMKK